MTIESLKSFFEPESIAVVGASRDPNKGGSIIVGNLKRWDSKFVERVYPINPGADKVLELKAYPSLREIPDKVDLVVVLTPARTLPTILKDAAEKNVKAVIIESAGFAEVGPQGIALQEEVVKIAKSAGIRIIGPNCTGVINANNNLITTFVEVTDITKGGVSVVAQTGMFAGTLIPEFISQNLGLSKVACFGNKADVDEVDLIEYYAEDPETSVMALYLEGIADGRRLIQVAKEITKKKPIIILKGGRSDAGAKAALSHTASIAGRDEVVEAAFKQIGILQAETLEDLIGFSKALDWLELPQGNRVAIVTASGGGGVLASDQCAQQGLNVVNLSEVTVNKLAEVFPAWMPPSNPIDMWPAISVAKHGLNEVHSLVLQSVIEDSSVDCILFILMALKELEQIDIDMIINMQVNNRKPMVCWLFGDPKIVNKWRYRFEDHRIPVSSSLSVTIGFLKALVTRKKYLDRLELEGNQSS